MREGLTLLLTSVGHEVTAVVSTGPDVLPALLTHRPDVAVVDVRMPPDFQDEGMRAALAARKEIPGLPVLVLSPYVEESYAAELLSDGARGVGYLLKDRVGRVDEFLDALERVARGGTALDPEVVAELFNRRRGSVLRTLTPREREVLKRMADGHDNTTIAKTLMVTERAVSKHIGSIFLKLGLPHTDSGIGIPGQSIADLRSFIPEIVTAAVEQANGSSSGRSGHGSRAVRGQSGRRSQFQCDVCFAAHGSVGVRKCG